MKCRHLLIETIRPSGRGQYVYLYKVVDGVVQDKDKKPIEKYDGYLGKSALLRVGKLGIESEEVIRDLQKVRSYIDR